MTNIAVPIPPSLSKYREHLVEFFSGMVRKLDMNSHKDTPEKKDIPVMTGMLLGEVNEFLQQYGQDKFDVNTLVELMDASNMAFLMYVALRNQGVKTKKDRLVEESLTVDADTGKVYCAKVRAGSQYKVGQEVTGYKNKDGYVYISLGGIRSVTNGYRIPRSHIVWFVTEGKWPTGVIDHINGVRDDDRRINLRDVSFSQNVHSRNKGHHGEFVTMYKPKGKEHTKNYGKFAYQRRWEGKTIRVGYFDNAEIARTVGADIWLQKAKKIEEQR